MEPHSISGTQGGHPCMGQHILPQPAKLNPQQGGRLRMKGFAYCISQIAPY